MVGRGGISGAAVPVSSSSFITWSGGLQAAWPGGVTPPLLRCRFGATDDPERGVRHSERSEESPSSQKRSFGVYAPQDDALSATDDPTHVNCLLKSTPSIFPRERRTRFCARIGRGSSSGRRNIIRISTF